MHEKENPISPAQARPQAIRTRLQIERQVRDLALSNLALDSKLRGCDVVAIRVDDAAPNGYAFERASVCQRKTGRPVRFELTEQTRQAIDDYLAASGKKPGDYLFSGRRLGSTRALSQSGSSRSDSTHMLTGTLYVRPWQR